MDCLRVKRKSKQIYFDNDTLYRGDKHRDIHVSKYVCHERLHKVINDQKIATVMA